MYSDSFTVLFRLQPKKGLIIYWNKCRFFFNTWKNICFRFSFIFLRFYVTQFLIFLLYLCIPSYRNMYCCLIDFTKLFTIWKMFWSTSLTLNQIFSEPQISADKFSSIFCNRTSSVSFQSCIIKLLINATFSLLHPASQAFSCLQWWCSYLFVNIGFFYINRCTKAFVLQ